MNCARAEFPLKALGRAWAWQRRLERGEVVTIHDIAIAEKVTDRFVSRIMRLAYLSPDVLERLLIWREPRAVTVNHLTDAAYLPWAKQTRFILEQDTHKLRTG